MAKQIRKSIQNKNKRSKHPRGVVHIQVSFNNTIITTTNLKGDVVSWSSAGACGFKGARKGTPFAAQRVAEAVARQSCDRGMRNVKVMVKGPGPGREKALFGLFKGGLRISLIRDITALPHNGCRPPKKRRL
jgi:small subunit ribosomal protein S11